MRKGELYHVGFLMYDRLLDWNKHLDMTATRLWKRYEKGEVHLVQRRREAGVWEYWAVPNIGGRHVERIRNRNNTNNRSNIISRA
jgi:hypothetical protein